MSAFRWLGLIGAAPVVLAAVLVQPLHAEAPVGGQYYRARAVAKLPRFMQAPVYPVPDVAEPLPDTSLAGAISQAYRSNPTLEAERYDLRATDENLGLALSELRPTSELQLTSQYSKTVPGRITSASRFSGGIITSNSLGAQIVFNQPIYTGGKASADIAAATAAIRAGRSGLSASEGDLLLQTITAYVDVRRDARSLAIREADLGQLRATLDEVHARRDAGELTKTDVAQTETQIQGAEANAGLTQAQLEQSRATYADLVGTNPGVLAPEPPLPQLPATIDEAFEAADRLNPDLARARYTEASSRQKIAAARAANHPTLMLQGTVGLSGQADPFDLHNEDQAATVQGVLTIPLISGGHNGAAIAQAEDTNGGDRLRIEAARRSVVHNIANAWNQMVTMRRNLAIDEAEVQSGHIFYEGSLAEYRAGLRSTFDVLYAQETLLAAHLAVVAARHDLYVAQATLLRYIGLLEVRDLTTGIGLYDPSSDVGHIQRRGSTPWDAPLRALDRVDKAGHQTRALDQPAALPKRAQVAPAFGPPPQDRYLTTSPTIPEPGTIGRPVNEPPRR
jgi:outer membrane protein